MKTLENVNKIEEKNMYKFMAKSILMCIRKDHMRDSTKRKARWSEQSFHVADRHMQMLYLRVTPEPVYHFPLFIPFVFLQETLRHIRDGNIASHIYSTLTPKFT